MVNRMKDLKKQLSTLRYFQTKRAASYFNSRQERFLLLNEDEKASFRKIILLKKNKVAQLDEMMKSVDIRLHYDSKIQSWIDTGIYVTNKNSLINNTSPDYSLIVYNSIEELKKENEQYGGNPAKESNYKLLCSVEKYIERILCEYRKMIDKCPTNLLCKFQKSMNYFEAMKDKPASTVCEALQRIAFWSDLFWQSGHNLMGFGRLDQVLSELGETESDEDIISASIEFYDAMHRYYPFKSTLEAMGDTGQIIVLGGKQKNGQYFCNRFTHLFIKALQKHPLPDPKLLLRVSDDIPMDLLRDAVDLISTGVGSPLLANDDVIIPALKEFGYLDNIAYNYITSACWEPVAYGDSSEVNNIRSINYAEAFVNTYLDEGFDKCTSYNEVLQLYTKKLIEYLDTIKRSLDNIQWEEDPLLNLFTINCINTGKCIHEGGANYNNFGLLGDGIGNTVNSLLLIKNHVFGDMKYSLTQLKEICVRDYRDSKELIDQLKIDSNYYGKDVNDVVETTEFLKSIVYKTLSSYKNRYGGSVKWGISSSNYMRNGRETGATPDGRRNGENLNVHISGNCVPYTELFRFASKLNYNGMYSNGNVVDYFVSPNLIKDNFNKFVGFIKTTIKLGFFEQQLNVVSSKTLIEARDNPEKYPNLIVRVWGFSSYFNDLNDDYKNVLITRAIKSEEARFT